MSRSPEHIGEEVVLPPLTFAHYGLVVSWHGLRWLDVIHGGGAVLWLGHWQPECGHGVLIGTAPRDRFDSWFRRSIETPDSSSAVVATAVELLFAVTLPERQVPGRPGISRAVLGHALAQARSSETWPTVSWRADGNSVVARIWHFAGAWIGFTEDLSDAHLVAVGVGIAPARLELATVGDDSLYGVDLSVPLTHKGLRGHRTADMVMPRPNRDGWHPDQLALV
jgi:hypothetical protein